MSVVQINRWQCEVCGRVQETREETSAYSDPVVGPPDGWTTDLSVPIDRRVHPNWDVCDACPQCAVAPDWSKYPAERRQDDAQFLRWCVDRAEGYRTGFGITGVPGCDHPTFASAVEAARPVYAAIAEQAKEQK